MIRKLRKWMTPAFLCLCILLGGASGVGAGAPGNALLQFVSLGVLAWFFLRSSSPLFPREAKPLLLLFLVLL